MQRHHNLKMQRYCRYIKSTHHIRHLMNDFIINHQQWSHKPHGLSIYYFQKDTRRYKDKIMKPKLKVNKNGRIVIVIFQSSPYKTAWLVHNQGMCPIHRNIKKNPNQVLCAVLTIQSFNMATSPHHQLVSYNLSIPIHV